MIYLFILNPFRIKNSGEKLQTSWNYKTIQFEINEIISNLSIEKFNGTRIISKKKKKPTKHPLPTPYLFSLSISVPSSRRSISCMHTCIDRNIDLDHDIDLFAMIKLVA